MEPVPWLTELHCAPSLLQKGAVGFGCCRTLLSTQAMGVIPVILGEGLHRNLRAENQGWERLKVIPGVVKLRCRAFRVPLVHLNLSRASPAPAPQSGAKVLLHFSAAPQLIPSTSTHMDKEQILSICSPTGPHSFNTNLEVLEVDQILRTSSIPPNGSHGGSFQKVTVPASSSEQPLDFSRGPTRFAHLGLQHSL